MSRSCLHIDKSKRLVLTPKDIRVIKKVATGMRNREIAEEFLVPETSIKKRLYHIMQKVGVENRVQLTNWMFENVGLFQ